jgi:hypothetical protein
MSGCGKKAGSQATPRDTLNTFYDSVVEADKAKFMSVMKGTDSELEVASALMDYFIAVSNFKKAIIKKYGASGWSHFEESGGAKLSMDLAGRKEILDAAKIEVTGEKASCTVPGEAQALHLSKKDGLWYIETGKLIDTGGMDSRQFTNVWRGMAELIKSKQKRIGQAGVTAESLDKELGGEMVRIIMGGEGRRSR